VIASAIYDTRTSFPFFLVGKKKTKVVPSIALLFSYTKGGHDTFSCTAAEIYGGRRPIAGCISTDRRAYVDGRRNRHAYVE
jgi:hypothetical protein